MPRKREGLLPYDNCVDTAGVRLKQDDWAIVPLVGTTTEEKDEVFLVRVTGPVYKKTWDFLTPARVEAWLQVKCYTIEDNGKLYFSCYRSGTMGDGKFTIIPKAIAPTWTRGKGYDCELLKTHIALSGYNLADFDKVFVEPSCYVAWEED